MPQPKTLSYAGFTFIRNREALRLEAYPDVKGVWTVGYGHTGRDVVRGVTVTQEQAEALLHLDVSVAVAAVNHGLKVETTQSEFDALVSFAYNVGAGAFIRSALLRDVNAGKIVDAEAQFLNWDHSGGKEVPGLLARRRAEAAMFEGEA